MDEKMHQEPRLLWVDNLRVIALIAVIFLHVSAPIGYQFGVLSNFKWMIGNVYGSLVRFCIPVFLMVTGALLLARKYELWEFLKKRITRIVLPFVFWSLVYLLFFLSIKISNDEIISFEFVKWAYTQFQWGSSFHFWYVYLILGLYFIIPIFGKWIRNSNEKEILYFLCIWLFTLFLQVPIIAQFIPKVDLTYFSGYIGYLILGYYLSIKSFENKRTNILVASVIIFTGVLITIIGTHFMSVKEGVFFLAFYGYLTPNVLLVSIGVFLLFKNIDFSNSRIIAFNGFISKYSYGIYLVHILVMIFLDKVGINWMFINPILGTPITTIICLVISLLIVFMVNKLPYGRYISG